MDQRLYARIPTDFEVRITNLERPTASCKGVLKDVSKSGAALITPDRFEAGDLVQIDTPEAVLFGHVIYTENDPQGYRSGIEIEQVLLGTSDVANLVHALEEGNLRIPKSVQS